MVYSYLGTEGEDNPHKWRGEGATVESWSACTPSAASTEDEGCPCKEIKFTMISEQLAFYFMYLLSVPCNCYPTSVWVLWTPYTSLTTFTGSLISSHPCQESVGPSHSFDALPMRNCFLWCLLLGCAALICCNFLSLNLKLSFL